MMLAPFWLHFLFHLLPTGYHHTTVSHRGLPDNALCRVSARMTTDTEILSDHLQIKHHCYVAEVIAVHFTGNNFSLQS